MSEAKNKVISVNYNLYKDTADGEMIESTEGKQPLVFLSGMGQMIPDFEKNIVSLGTGDTFSFGIKSELAYGKRTEEAVIELPQDMFMKDGDVMSFREAWVSGKAVGSPGAVALYKTAHERSGKIPWDELFLYAIDLAENGFKVSARLAGFVKALQSYGRLSVNEGSKDYFYPNGNPLKEGHILKNQQVFPLVMSSQIDCQMSFLSHQPSCFSWLTASTLTHFVWNAMTLLLF